MFVELRNCDASSENECSKSDWELVFIEKSKKKDSDKKGGDENKWKEGIIFPPGYVDCLKKKKKEAKKKEKIKELEEKIKALSGDKKKILRTDDSLQAIACAYKSTNYDGFFFPGLDKAKDLAQIFRTYSLPYLLIVEVVGSKLDEGTETKIINALKAGVDYIAVNGALMAELEKR